MIDWVINTNLSLKLDKLLIVSSNKDSFLKYADKYEVVTQKVPRGTGDAVKCALSMIENFEGIVIVSYADTPFISKSTLSKLVKSIKSNNDIAITGFIKNELNTYGKIFLSKKIDLSE